MQGFIVKHTHQGIGKIDGEDEHVLRVQFLESGEVAHFALTAVRDNDLKRHKLPIGTQCLVEERTCVVTGYCEHALPEDAYSYQVTYDADGLETEVLEVVLSPAGHAVFTNPLDKLSCRDPGSYSLFGPRERLVTAIQSQLRNGNGLRAMLSARIDLRPHQAYVAGVVLLDESRRYLLADEVGLGKTIEAGIIITDLLISKPDAKVLILCPGALTQQWLCEMYSKFSGTLFRMLEMTDNAEGEWSNIYKLIASFEEGGLQNSELLFEKDWDLVVIDEVHHLLSSEPLYKVAQQLSLKTPSLLLLSALPAQRREDEFLRLLALLEPSRYTEDVVADTESFKQLYSNQQTIGRKLRLARLRLDGMAIGDFTRDEALAQIDGLAQLDFLESDQRLQDLKATLRHVESDDAFAEMAGEFLHHVGSTYRINRRILKNRRQRLLEKEQIAPIHRILQREPFDSEQLEHDLNNAIHAMLQDMHSKDENTDLVAVLAGLVWQSTVHPNATIDLLEIIQQAEPQRLNAEGKGFLQIGNIGSSKSWPPYILLLCNSIKSLVSSELLACALAAARTWQRADSSYSRLDKLKQVLNDLRESQLKVLIFVGYPSVAELVSDLLQEEFGDASTVAFLSDEDRETKEANVRAFQSDNETWLMVSDESGGEGRNFQFADCLIHYDTPWNVSRIEQRIGRLDRLGRETLEVNSIVIYDQSSVEAGLVRCYEVGLGVYESSISGLEFALRDVEAKLTRVALEEGLDGLVETVDAVAEIVADERGRDESDALLDEASFDRNVAQGFLRVRSSEESEIELENAFVEYFKLIAHGTYALNDPQFPRGLWRFRGDQIHQIRNELTSRLGVADGSFRRHIAQQRVDLQFFGVGNPLFDAIYHSLFTEILGRTYAIEIHGPTDVRWMGFEYIFYPAPAMEFLHNNPGLINRARQCFDFQPTHVFCNHMGEIEPSDSRIPEIRESQTLQGHNTTWWNFTHDNAHALADVFTNISWEDRITSSHSTSKKHALAECKEKVNDKLKVSLKRLKLQIANALLSDSESVYVQPLRDLELAITNWSLQLDSVGFLAINAGLRERVYAR